MQLGADQACPLVHPCQAEVFVHQQVVQFEADVGVKAQKAVERVLLEVTERWTPRTRLSRSDFRANEQLLASIARDLGFLQPPGVVTKAATDSAAFVTAPPRPARRGPGAGRGPGQGRPPAAPGN